MIPATLAFLNRWLPCIKCKLVAYGSVVPFLDCEFAIRDGDAHVSYRLYQKPLNKYLYLPRNSCHPVFVFYCICFGECLRTLRRCSNSAIAEPFLRLLEQRLVRRGYTHGEIRYAFSRARACHNDQQDSAPKPVKSNKSNKRFFRVLHSSSLNRGFIKQALSKHAHLLDRADFELATSVQRNTFRQLYPFCWPRSSL